MLTEALAERDAEIVKLHEWIDELEGNMQLVSDCYVWTCFLCECRMLVSYGDDTWYECPHCDESIHVCDGCEYRILPDDLVHRACRVKN